MIEPGHTVLALAVPELEWFVRGRWEHYEPDWVSTDPRFTHAHITALSPYLSRPGDDDLARVAAIAAMTKPIDYLLGEVGVFPDGTIHLRPEPAEPFAALTRRLCEAFPQCPPYDGRYDVLAPHLTLDHVSGPATVDSIRDQLGDTVPVRCRADRLELHWYQRSRCHLMADWPLGLVAAGPTVAERTRS
jgi:hypothetical protein